MNSHSPSDKFELDDYRAVGWYGVKEAKGLLSMLEEANIRFLIDAPDSGNVQTPSLYGSYGQQAQIYLYVHVLDDELFQQIHNPRFLGED